MLCAVLVNCHTGVTQLEGLFGVFPAPLKDFAGDAWLNDSSTAEVWDSASIPCIYEHGKV